MEQLKLAFEGKIDYQGQRLADRINQEVVVMGALLSLLMGFAFSSISVMMMLFGAVALVDFILVVPAWPFYNKYPTKWLPNRPASSSQTAEQAPGSAQPALVEGTSGAVDKNKSA